MEKIKSFRIRKLSLEGFKKFIELTEFEFGDMTSISGHNSQGKSSIAEAVTYAITGVPFFGGEKSIDRLYSMDTKEMRVSLAIEIEGTAHELVRERVNDNTAITYDGVPVRQSDLNIMFGERDVFLSIFNPLYFVEELGEKGRNLLERYLPAVPHEEVMAKLSAGNRALIESSNMRSPEGLLKQVIGEIKELGDGIIYSEGQRDLLADQERDRTTVLDEKRKNLKILFDALSLINAKRSKGLDFLSMRERLSELYMKLDDLSGNSVTPDTQDIDAEIARLTQALEQRRSEQYVSKFTQSMSDISATLTELGKRYKAEKSIYGGLKPGIQCPTCKRDITAEDLPAVKAAYADSIKTISAEGIELTGQLKEVQEMDAKAKEVFEQFQSEDVSHLEEQVVEQKDAREAIASANGEDSRTDIISAIKAEIRGLETDIENGNLTDDEMKVYKDGLAEYANMDAEIKTLEAQDQRAPADMEQDISAIKKTIEEKEALETAVRTYISERISLVFDSFDTLLNRVSLQLYDIVKKTGEVKDVFKCTYDGRPYRYLSYSEKVKTGLEISGLLKSLTDSDYPVFIDNGESVPVIDNVRQTGQCIFAQVVKGKPLTVTALNAPAQKAAA